MRRLGLVPLRLALMSEMPTNIASSAAQAGFQSREVGKARDATTAGQANAATRQTNAVSQPGETVETDDADSRVFTESEGAGGQGRQLDDDSTGAKDDGAPPSSEGITQGDDGRLHLDLEA